MSVLYARDKNDKVSPVPNIKVEGYLEGIAQGKAEGFDEGKAEGIAQGYTEGKQAEYDEFWDEAQLNGNRKIYDYAFSGGAWTRETFKPKYNMSPDVVGYMFTQFGRDNPILEEEPLDLVEHLKGLGVELDFSKNTGGNNFFYYARMSHVGIVDLRNRNNQINQVFGGKYINKIDGIILREEGSNFTTSFDYCSNLEYVRFQGKTTGNDNFQWSTKLSKDSIKSIVNSLSDNASGRTLTLSKTAVNNAFTTAEWDALKAEHTNWTFVLA